VKRGVRVFRSASEMGTAAAEHAAAVLASTIDASDRCRLVLTGGTTASVLYEVLASRFRETLRWEDTHVFWGDERYVGHTDPHSNYRMARETLLDHVRCPSHQIHPMPTDFSDPADAARDYDRLLDAELGGGAAFDLVLLSLGTDAHVASIFPGSAALDDESHWALAVTGPVEPASRLTLTARSLRRARHIMILAAGTSKAAALRATLEEAADPRLHPAAAILATTGELTWWVDDRAAALLDDLHSLDGAEGRQVTHG